MTPTYGDYFTNLSTKRGVFALPLPCRGLSSYNLSLLDPCLQGIGAPSVPRESESIPTFCHSFGGTTPDQAIGSQIHFPEQGLGPKTVSVTLLRPSVHTQVLPRRPVSPRGIEVSDRYTILSGREESYLACSTSIRPPRQPRSLLYIYYMSDRHAQQLVEWGMRRSVSAPKGAENQYFKRNLFWCVKAILP